MAASGRGFHKADVSSMSIPLRVSPMDDEFINSVGMDASSTKIGRWNLFGRQFFIAASNRNAVSYQTLTFQCCHYIHYLLHARVSGASELLYGIFRWFLRKAGKAIHHSKACYAQNWDLLETSRFIEPLNKKMLASSQLMAVIVNQRTLKVGHYRFIGF